MCFFVCISYIILFIFITISVWKHRERERECVFSLCDGFCARLSWHPKTSPWKTRFLLETIMFKFRTTLCGLEFPAKVFMWEPPMFVLLVGATNSRVAKPIPIIYIYIYSIHLYNSSWRFEGSQMIHSWLRSFIILGITCESNDY